MSDSPLSILERAISDVGQWTWWTGDPAKAIQLEFGGVQLWFAPIKDGQPPSGQVALRFQIPKAVLFISRSDDPALSSHDWPTRFQADELGAFNVGHDEFTLSDAETVWSLIEDATHTIELVGVRPQKSDFDDKNAWIGFWAGPVGMIVFLRDGCKNNCWRAGEPGRAGAAEMAMVRGCLDTDPRYLMS